VEQPTPDVTEADVERILRRDFPAKDVTRVESLLRELGPRMSARVVLAVLKLSNGSIQAVRENVEAARLDWRDIIAEAEYPTYLRRVPGAGRLSPQQRDQIIQADWEQYARWLKR